MERGALKYVATTANLTFHENTTTDYEKKYKNF